MDREAWRSVIFGVTKSRTRLSDWTELNWLTMNNPIYYLISQLGISFVLAIHPCVVNVFYAQCLVQYLEHRKYSLHFLSHTLTPNKNIIFLWLFIDPALRPSFWEQANDIQLLWLECVTSAHSSKSNLRLSRTVISPSSHLHTYSVRTTHSILDYIDSFYKNMFISWVHFLLLQWD